MNHNHRHTSSSSRGRTEPALGDLDSFDEDPRLEESRVRSRRRRPPPSHRRWPWLLLVLVVLVAAGVWTQRDTIRGWLPQTHFTQLMDRADAALAAGHLTGHDGNSARELYSAARTLEPDNSRVERGLTEVGKAELARAKQALAAGKYDQAADSARIARELLGGGEQLDRVDKKLARQQANDEKLEERLHRASQALADGNLTGEQGAAALYRKALTADPDNAIARHGLDNVGAALAKRIRANLVDGALDGAADQLDRLGKLLPDYSGLAKLRGELESARQKARGQRNKRLAQADKALQDGHLIGSGDDNALAGYRRVLQADPGNDRAQQGVANVANALLERADKRMQQRRFADADQLLDQARQVGGESPALQSARKRLAKLKKEAAGPPPLTAEQKAKVARLLARAHAAASSGHLMLPPGDSAYDLYRSALAIDGNNADAMSGLASLPSQTQSLFEQALGRGDTARAGELVSVYAELAPGSSALSRMQTRLAAAKAGG